ncbi:MAG: hypothetical protein M0001_09605 [Treponema sp.]|nr:hypothetical protein [Treponema sp.]
MPRYAPDLIERIASRVKAALDEVEGLLRGALEKRLLAMSTTHFGMASPVERARSRVGKEAASS